MNKLDTFYGYSCDAAGRNNDGRGTRVVALRLRRPCPAGGGAPGSAPRPQSAGLGRHLTPGTAPSPTCARAFGQAALPADWGGYGGESKGCARRGPRACGMRPRNTHQVNAAGPLRVSPQLGGCDGGAVPAVDATGTSCSWPTSADIQGDAGWVNCKKTGGGPRLLRKTGVGPCEGGPRRQGWEAGQQARGADGVGEGPEHRRRVVSVWHQF